MDEGSRWIVKKNNDHFKRVEDGILFKKHRAVSLSLYLLLIIQNIYSRPSLQCSSTFANFPSWLDCLRFSESQRDCLGLINVGRRDLHPNNNCCLLPNETLPSRKSAITLASSILPCCRENEQLRSKGR